MTAVDAEPREGVLLLLPLGVVAPVLPLWVIMWGFVALPHVSAGMWKGTYGIMTSPPHKWKHQGTSSGRRGAHFQRQC